MKREKQGGNLTVSLVSVAWKSSPDRAVQPFHAPLWPVFRHFLLQYAEPPPLASCSASWDAHPLVAEGRTSALTPGGAPATYRLGTVRTPQYCFLVSMNLRRLLCCGSGLRNVPSPFSSGCVLVQALQNVNHSMLSPDHSCYQDKQSGAI